MSFLPNSRFMNELATIMPDESGVAVAAGSASSKNRSMNGTTSEYLHVARAVTLPVQPRSAPCP